VAPAWPKEHGGCGWDVRKRYIFAEECARAGAPPLSPMGLGMCGPVLIGYGTPEQQKRFLPPMLSGEEFWCQGYSERGSGSDLASLAMEARDEGDAFVCTGHKIWTTHGHAADWIFCLVRTSKEDIPQKGITFILIDMRDPGVTVRPVISLSGEHIQNEIFFDAVRVPKANVVGEVGRGWTVAKYLMEFERGGSAMSPSLHARLKAIRRRAAGGADPGETLWDSRSFRARFFEIETRVEALGQIELRVMAEAEKGGSPGVASSMLKTLGTELSQAITELAVEAAGAWAAPWQPHTVYPGGPTPALAETFEAVGPKGVYTAIAKYFNDRAGTIYAGTSEVQRNIMSKAVLKL
jgi:alkylation response protein AidB-like acyl-CoA dehydrogenase